MYYDLKLLSQFSSSMFEEWQSFGYSFFLLTVFDSAHIKIMSKLNGVDWWNDIRIIHFFMDRFDYTRGK